MFEVRSNTQTQVAGVFALVAIAAATVLFVAAMLMGLRSSPAAEDATSFEADARPEVRYVMQYEVDEELFSFYQRQGGEQVARAAIR